MGVGEGLTGKCYALPTMEGDENFRKVVEHFNVYLPKEFWAALDNQE